MNKSSLKIHQAYLPSKESEPATGELGNSRSAKTKWNAGLEEQEQSKPGPALRSHSSSNVLHFTSNEQDKIFKGKIENRANKGEITN
jgi:hypothetical protein